ncbi:MAG: hypothetical protein JRF47_16725 [Deltaproteobacteria bacterium]|nr:hypothetical protein [Deltaproteobacteria bacterium]
MPKTLSRPFYGYVYLFLVYFYGTCILGNQSRLFEIRAVSRHTRDLVWQPLLQWAVLGIINLVMAFTSFRLAFVFYHAIFI